MILFEDAYTPVLVLSRPGTVDQASEPAPCVAGVAAHISSVLC